jgi:NADH-quinone oxidoreductase subunit C
MTPRQTVELLQQRFGNAIGETVEFRGEVSVFVARGKILDVCRYLAGEHRFDMLTDLSGVDHYGEHPRFEVVYHLYSMPARIAVRLKVPVPEDDLVVDSVVDVWKTADWHEREAFDMFGIRFQGHPNLKRILMWDGYPHHPLRKDFPLAGLPAELPETAVEADTVRPAPMLGGPFVATTGTGSSIKREPRQVDAVTENIERLRNPSKKETV